MQGKRIDKATSDEIKRLYADDYSPTYIAKKLGLDKKSVYNHTKGSPRNKYRFGGEVKARIIPILADIYGRYQAGEKLIDLASEFNVSDDYLYMLLRKNNYPIKDRGWNFSVGKFQVTPHEFVEAWQNSQTVNEVAEKLKMPTSAVASRASNYRANGIPLKSMYFNNRKIDWNELAEFAKSFREDES